MGTLGALLVPALGGYLFLARFNATRDLIRRESGYHGVFRAGVVGLLLFGLGRLAVVGAATADEWLAPLLWYEPLTASWKTVFPMTYSGTAAFSVIAGWTLPYLLNPFVNRLEARRRSALETDDHIGLVVDEALTRNRPIQISLASRRIYIGFPLIRAFQARDDEGDLVIVPLWSGYRDEHTLRLRRTVNYAPVIRSELKNGKGLTDFRIAVPMAAIQSARPYDRNTYRALRLERRRRAVIRGAVAEAPVVCECKGSGAVPHRTLAEQRQRAQPA